MVEAVESTKKRKNFSHARSQTAQRELSEDFKTSPQMNTNAHRWEDTNFTNYHELECGGKPSATPPSLTSTPTESKAASRFACRRTPREHLTTVARSGGSV